MIIALIRSLKRFVSRVKQDLKLWSKPAFPSMAVGSLSDLRRSRKGLIVENAMLRQQLIVDWRWVLSVFCITWCNIDCRTNGLAINGNSTQHLVFDLE